MLKILHTADWHLGNFSGPNIKNNQNARLQDICKSIEFLIAKAENEKPDIIIIAGDIFNQAKTWSERGLTETGIIIKYIKQLAAIAPTCVLRGTANHDGKMHFDLLDKSLHDNNNIYIIDEACVKNINNLANIAFVPIFDKGEYRASADDALDKQAENNYFCDKIRDTLLDLRTQCDDTIPSILVTHYTVIGSTMPNGQLNILSTAEPVIDPLTLIQADYTLTCLGHIHKPQQVPACNNVYYSGALTALNFNDEKDTHGFYIHSIIDKDNITSEFIENECERKFATIFLDEDTLMSIINKNYDIENIIDPDYCCDKIIRIIYSCSDVVNKLLKKSLLEKAFYKQTSVFYVHEIMPLAINSTVNKKVILNTMDIKDNLEDFLKTEQAERDNISDNQIADCVALAQPIIDEVLANINIAKNTGIFTPIEIEVKNYRNYKNAIFNYDDVKFCVINGENGAGKSSLFMDAMLDALFESPREGNLTGWINNSDKARSGSIKFTFSIGDNIYKITRTRQKSGKATLNIAELNKDENDNLTWIDASAEKTKDTQLIINQIIGMDMMTMKSCGLIMQDAYGLFLQADKSTRMDVLGNILGLSFFNDLSNAVSELNQICQREISKSENEQQLILSKIKDTNAIEESLAEINTANVNNNNELKNCDLIRIANTSKRDNISRDIKEYERLTAEIEKLNSKNANLSKTCAEHERIVSNATGFLNSETMILNNNKRHDELVIIEKEMAIKNTELTALLDNQKKLETSMSDISKNLSDIDKSIAKILNEKTAIEAELAATLDIQNKANSYDTVKLELVEIENQNNKLQELRNLADTKRQTLDNLLQSERKNAETWNKQLQELNNKINMLNESGCPILEKATCKFLADAQKSVTILPDAIAKYNTEHSLELSNIAKTKEEIETLEVDIKALKISIPDINIKKQQLAVLEDCVHKLASLPAQQNLLKAYSTQTKELQENKQANELKLQNVVSEYNTLMQKINILTKELVDYPKIQNEIATLKPSLLQKEMLAIEKTNKTNAEKRITEIKKEIQAFEFDIIDKKREISNLKIDVNEINIIDTNIKACQARSELLKQAISENSKLIGKLEVEIKTNKDNIKTLDNLKQLIQKSNYIASNCEWLKKAFSRNGLPHNIIRSAIPLLETTASNILNAMSNNRMSIEFKTEKTLTTKKEVATLDVIVQDTITGDLPYLSRSGGERVKAALSVILALAEMKSSESGVQLGFLFIDEPPFLDAQGIEAYCDALETIQERYQDIKIMAITHDPEMKARFAQSIDVIKTNDSSELILNL